MNLDFDISSMASKSSLQCRNFCYSSYKKYAYFKPGQNCSCGTDLAGYQISQWCTGTDKWLIYRVGGNMKDVVYPIDMRVHVTLPTNKGYVRPNETVIFTMTTSAVEMVTYYINFDDGVQKVTRDEKVGYAWRSVGVYNISINAVTRISSETKYVLLEIQWRKEGIPPEVVVVKVENSLNISFQVLNYITAIGIEDKNCTLNFGDGEIVEYQDETEMILTDFHSHIYSGFGFYHVSLVCFNNFGKTSNETDTVAIHPKVEFEYYPMGEDITISVIGIENDLYWEQLVVLVDDEEVSKTRSGDNISISESVFSYSGDHVVQLKGNERVMFTKIFSLQHSVNDVEIVMDVLHNQVDIPLYFNFIIGKGDFLHIHIEYGDGQEDYLYAPLADNPVYIVKNHSYNSLGQYLVTITVANDISSQKVQQLISIERPVSMVGITAGNTTVIGQPTLFTFEVDMDQLPTMPVQVKFDYGDKNTETVIIGQQTDQPTLLTHLYTYNTYGMYRVRATVGNNISSVNVEVTLQVGEHIGYVDVYADKNRVIEQEEITFTIQCPLGVPIKLEVDTGDDNVITVHRPEMSQQFVDGMIPSSTTYMPFLSHESGSGAIDGSGEVEGYMESVTELGGLLSRNRRGLFSNNTIVGMDTSGDEQNNDEIVALSSMFTILPTVNPTPNEDFRLVYRYSKPGTYFVQVKVSNKFNSAHTWLCPEITVVAQQTTDPMCSTFEVNLLNVSSQITPIVKMRSDEINLLTETNMKCDDAISKTPVTRYTWKMYWLTNYNDWRPELEVCHTDKPADNLVINPNTLWYGMYKIKVTASVWLEDISKRKRKAVSSSSDIPTLVENESDYLYMNIVRSPLVAKIKDSKEQKDVTLWDIINVNMTPSYDPDVSVANKSGMQFYLFCYLKGDAEVMQLKSLDQMIQQSSKIANNSFNTASIYETGPCFESYKRVWVVGHEAVFPGDHMSTNETLVFDLFITKDVRTSRTTADIRVWTTNLTMDNALNAIDALLASGDTSAALMVIDMVTDGLNDNTNSSETEEAKNERKALRGKLINVMGNVADSLSNFDQLDKTAGSVEKLTAVEDEVTDDGRTKAAGALGSAADKADELAQDADLNVVTGMAQSMVGAAGNVLPFGEDEEVSYVQVSTTTTTTPKLVTDYDLLKPTIDPPSEEPPEEVIEPVIPCCEREAGLCQWIEPSCVVIEEDEAKSMLWDDIMCDAVHPDDLIVIRGRYEQWNLALKLNKNDQKKQTTSNGWKACMKVGEVIGKKQDGVGSETNIDTPKMKMKVASLDSASDASLGAFSVPTDVMGNLGGGAGATVMDTPNPFTYSDSASSVKGKVMTMAFKNADGSPMQISNTTEPFNIWMPGKPELIPEPGNFTFLSSPTGAAMNYHTINITTNDTGLHVIIRPKSPYDVYYVYLQYAAFPNETYYDWRSEVPNSDFYDTNDTWKLDQLQYTVFPPQNYTMYNGSYKIGIRLKETRLSLEQLTQENNFTYSLQVFLSGCRFWDDKRDTWSSEGCEIGKLTTIKETQCLCNHLTSFGGDFVVPPNTIDFNTVFSAEKFLESMPVFVTVMLIIILYIAVLVWARKEDKKDLVKWGSMPLEDNLPTDTYHYQLTVHTGVKKNAGTRSNVSFILSGDECDSGVRRLYDGHRKEFPSGSIYNYVLSVENCLGPLTYLRIWHDNAGVGKKKGWHLNQLVITDIQTGQKYFFLCDRWLTVEEDDGQVERILPVAGLGDLSAFKHLFSSSVRKKLSSDHMWFSILSRPTKSTFTRVQRVSCCVALLFLTMITNCMFFKSDEGAQTTKALKVGPFSFTLHQLFISIVSTAIVFPPSLAIVTIFKKARPKKNTTMQINTSQSKRFKWRTINQGSSLWRNVEKTRLQKFKDAMHNIITAHQKSKYEASEDLEQKVIRRKGKKKKVPTATLR